MVVIRLLLQTDDVDKTLILCTLLQSRSTVFSVSVNASSYSVCTRNENTASLAVFHLCLDQPTRCLYSARRNRAIKPVRAFVAIAMLGLWTRPFMIRTLRRLHNNTFHEHLPRSTQSDFTLPVSHSSEAAYYTQSLLWKFAPSSLQPQMQPLTINYAVCAGVDIYKLGGCLSE